MFAWGLSMLLFAQMFSGQLLDGRNAIQIAQYGAKCDGVTDDTRAIQAAYNAASAANQSEIDWPANRTCVISSTITLVNAQNVRVYGGYVLWQGTAATPALKYQNDLDCFTEGFHILSGVQTNHPIGSAFLITMNNNNPISSNDVFESNTVEGITSTGLNVGFELSPGAGANNDEMQFYANEVRNYSLAGWSYDTGTAAAQQIDYNYVGNKCYGNGTGQYCVNDPAGAGFTWIGGAALGDNVADFNLTTYAYDPYLIESVASEGSNRFLVMGFSNAPAPVTLRNIRFNDNKLNADGHYVILSTQGPLDIDGGRWGLTGPCGDFYWNHGGTAYGEIVGVTLAGVGSGAGCGAINPANIGSQTNAVVESNLVFQDGKGNAAPAIFTPAAVAIQ